MNYVFGYTVAHDVSARDWQLEPGKNGGQWLIGKAMDGFCPLGPAIVMKEDINGIILNFFFWCFCRLFCGGFVGVFLWMRRGLELNFFSISLSQAILLAAVD